MIHPNKAKSILMAGGLVLIATACSTQRPAHYSTVHDTTPVFHSATSPGTVQTAQATSGATDINQLRVDETDTTGPGSPRGDRTSADPSETSTQGAGSRSLVGQQSIPVIGSEGYDSTRTTLSEDTTARGGSEMEDNNTTTTGNASSGNGQNVVIPLYKETLTVGKRQVDAGTVTIRKNVQTETVNQPVELRTETVTIDRQPAQANANSTGGTSSSSFDRNGNSSGGGQPFEQREFTIRLMREEPVVEKRVVPAGEVIARTDFQTQTTNVQSQVRREDVQVNQGQGTTGVNYSRNFQDTTGNAGGSTTTGESSFSGSGTGTGGQTITSLSQLSGEQAASFAGQTVNVSGAAIRAIVGPRVIALDAGGQPVYVRMQQPMADLKEGMRVNVSGTAQSPSQLSADDLSGAGAHILSSQPVFIEAQTVQPER